MGFGFVDPAAGAAGGELDVDCFPTRSQAIPESSKDDAAVCRQARNRR